MQDGERGTTGGFVAGMAWRDIAASAYRAYTQSVNIEEMPAFENLPRPFQIAWEAAVRQVGAILTFKFPNPGNPAPEELHYMEKSWQGWMPSPESQMEWHG